jgi:hypothetical protein
MTEMEHAYLVYAMTGGTFSGVYFTGDAPDSDILGLSPSMAAGSLARWHDERTHADQLLSSATVLESVSPGNRLSVRWNLIKVIQEYARHNGHADLIRERIDGSTGE